MVLPLEADVIVYSSDSYATWQEVSSSVLNASGMKERDY